MIKVNDVIILPGYPAVLHKKQSAIVIADLHLGYEEEAAKHGFFLPAIQYKKAVKLIEELKFMFNPKKLIINGDIKNSFDRLTMQEREEIIKFLAKAKELYDEVILIRGNHDNYLPVITERMGVIFTEDYQLSAQTLIIHGHKLSKKIKEYKLILIGHEHPAFIIKDELGSIIKLPCFLRIPTTLKNEILVLPAAGYYQTGNPVSLERESYLSPLVKEYGIIEKAIPIIVDTENKDLYEFPPLGKIIDIIKQS